VLTVTVLGCDGSHAGAGGGLHPPAEGVGAGAGSGYLLRWWPTGTAIWVDAGPGTFAALQRACDPTQLDAIVLTHRHRDHCSDVDGWITAARWLWGWQRPPLPVYAADGVDEEVGREADGIVAWHRVGDGDGVDVGPVRLTFSATDHGPPTVALAASVGGRRVGYSADTGPRWPLASLGRDLDLVLCEATYTQAYEGTGQHMSGRQAGAQARAARARRLVVTHRWPAADPHQVLAEATAAFGRPVTAAAPGQGYSL